jgi:hypothetical protein
MRGPIRGTSALCYTFKLPLTPNFSSWLALIECSCIDTTGVRARYDRGHWKVRFESV